MAHARLREVWGRDELARVLDARSRPAARVNTARASVEEARRRLRALGVRTQPAPFAPEVLFLDDPLERPVGTLWEHQAGLLYSQDAASALAVAALDPQPGERVLDLCAAPGGKTSHISARMRHEGLVVANEANPTRFRHMCSNLDRLACLNVVGTVRDGLRARFPLLFDRVLVDAPCSNLGSMHEQSKPVDSFDEEKVRRLVGVQRGLLRQAFEATREAGVIVYSTCTLEPEENEGVASWFLENFPVDIAPFDPGIGRQGLAHAAGRVYADAVVGARRVHPGDAGTDGFFVVRFVKRAGAASPAPWRPSSVHEEAPGLVDEVRSAYGLADGALEGAVALRTGARRAYALRVPSVPDALAVRPERAGVTLSSFDTGAQRLSFDAATAWGAGARESVELDETQARAWMAGEDVACAAPRAWRVVTCDGEPLGASRAYGARLGNFVPKERRVAREGPARVGFLAARGVA